jgi:filamentous hemagglutinin family protein
MEMKKLRKISEKYYLRQIVIYWVMWSTLLTLTPVRVAMAHTPVVSDAGGATVTQSVPNLTDVLVNQQETYMVWSNFNTTAAETVAFRDGALSGTKVFSDITGGQTHFNGHLTGEEGMALYFRNPAGFIFGNGSIVNVTQLLVTSLNIKADDLMNGLPFEFTDGLNAGDVINKGSITAERLYLIGKNVFNWGCLRATDYVVMAAGDKVIISEPGSSVAVEAFMPDGWESGSGVHVVGNDGGIFGGITVNESLNPEGDGTAKVILAAGDIWSTALVKAYSDGGSDAVATVEIKAAGDVSIKNDVIAEAVGNGENNAKATIDISAGKDVEITNGGWWMGTDTEVRATAKDGKNNTATVNVTADGDVDVIACSADAKVKAEAYGDCYEALSNQANVDVTAGGNVHVKSEGGQMRTWWTGLGRHRTKHSSFTPYVASVEAIAENASNSNTATVDMTAGGDIVVLSKDGGEAKVETYAGNALDSQNIANINLTAEDGYVLVHGIGGEYSTCEGFTPSEASVEATAENSGNKEDGTNSANITIVAKDIVEETPVTVASVEGSGEEECLGDGDVGVIGVNGGRAEIEAKAMHGYNNTSGVDITAADDVQVIAKCFEQPSQAEIMALAKYGNTNTADVLICTEGGVKVKGESGGEAEIEALAKNGFTNTASVGIGAKGEEGVQVIADDDGEAEISSKAKDGYTNTASTIVCTKGGVEVKAKNGGEAGILSQAVDGIFTNAYVGVCAVGKVMVKACQCCESLIRAEAGTSCPESSAVSADAETVVVSHQGNVEVKAYNHGHSGIEAEAQGAQKNTAKVGVAAGADLSPSDVFNPAPIIPSSEVLTASIYDGPEYSTGNVIVEASCGSEAQVFAYAHDAHNLGENTAKAVVCAPGKVDVHADECSTSRIKSQAGTLPWQEGDYDSTNKATTKVYASEVTVDAPGPGNGIRAYAQGVENQGKTNWCLTSNGEVAEIVTNENGSSELIIQDYSKRTDCPDCPPCPCEKVTPSPVFAPVAPLPPYHIPRIEGCPELTQAAAAELGIPEETLQVGMGNALALNPNIQPCQACETLVNAASILKDEDGSRMAAMVQAFNTLAPADVPYTPEMATSIAMAFENAAEGTQYASAMEFIDAFVQYAIALDELGSPVGDSKAFVMNKYGAGMTGSDNANMTAFVTACIESGKAL